MNCRQLANEPSAPGIRARLQPSLYGINRLRVALFLLSALLCDNIIHIRFIVFFSEYYTRGIHANLWSKPAAAAEVGS